MSDREAPTPLAPSPESLDLTVELSTRVVELEIRASYQERLIDTLDEVVRTFATRVEYLEKELKGLRASLDGPPAVGPADEKPPHY